MIEELGFYCRQEQEMLLHSIQMRSEVDVAFYPVGTRFVLGVMQLECDANHSSSTAEVSLWHGNKSRTGIMLPFCLYPHNTEMKTCTYFTQLILHLHKKSLQNGLNMFSV
jgi:hypothetical protein